MGLFDRFLRRRGPRTPGFQLVLPDGPWREDHEPTHYDYGSEERGEQLTIVVAHTQHPLDNPALLLAVLELVAARQRVLLTVSGGAARFEELRSDTVPGRVDVAFDGVDPKAEVQFRFLAQGRPDRVVTATYHKYSPLLSRDAFDPRAALVLAGVKVA